MSEIQTNVTQVESTSPPVDDFRADVQAAFDTVKAKTENTEQAAAPADTSESSSERIRNERGQFLSKPEGAEPSDTEPKNTDETHVTVTEEAPSNALTPPKTWSADEKALWSTLDPALQKAITRRDAEIDNGGRQWSEQKRSYDEVLTPVRTLAQRNGVNEREAINRLVEASDWLERDPKDFLTKYAQHYGISFNANEQQSTRPQTQPDPAIAQLHQTVSQLQNDWDQRQAQEVRSVIQDFASSPGHEHFDTVKVDMGRLMQIDPSLSLDDAYDRAIWANKDVRAGLLAAQAAKPNQVEKDRQQTARAKASAVSPRGSGPTGTVAAPKKEYDTVRDAVVAAWTAQGGQL